MFTIRHEIITGHNEWKILFLFCFILFAWLEREFAERTLVNCWSERRYPLADLNWPKYLVRGVFCLVKSENLSIS